MEPTEPAVSTSSTIQPSHPPPPPPPPPPPQPDATTAAGAANVPNVQGRRNMSFSWSLSSSSTSSFNSMVDSFKKNDISTDIIEPQLQPTLSSGELDDRLKMRSSSRRRSHLTSGGGEYADYDPNRIPNSIFSKPSNNNMDWSIASNDSLFSIQTGSNSFSMGDFMLPNYEQFIYPSSSESNNNPFGLPITAEEEVGEEEHGRKSSCIWEDFQEITKEPAAAAATSAITEPPEIVVTKKEDSPSSERILLESCSNVSDARFSASSARMSEESGNSCNSFAFPVLTSEGAALNEPQASPDTMGTGPPLQPSARRDSNEKENSGPETTTEWGTGSEGPPLENNSSWLSCFACCTMKCHCCGRARCSKADTDEKLDT